MRTLMVYSASSGKRWRMDVLRAIEAVHSNPAWVRSCGGHRLERVFDERVHLRVSGLVGAIHSGRRHFLSAKFARDFLPDFRIRIGGRIHRGAEIETGGF